MTVFMHLFVHFVTKFLTMDSREDVLKKDVIHEYKDCEGYWIEEEGTLTLNFYKHYVKDDEVKQVIASMDYPQQCDKVRIIDLHGCSRITDAALKIMGESFRHLTKLNLSSCKGGCGKVTDKGIIAVLRNNPTITELNLSHCKKATSASIDAVIEHCPNIERLYVSCVGLTSLPDNIGNLSKLKRLYLCGNSITTLPLSIGELNENCRLTLCNNPIKNVPPSVLETGDGGKAIIRFFSGSA
jgi:ABC-type transporter Mla MlaB component